jgi:hypothetical protein
MAILDDIEVVVVSEDKELTEYDNPDGEDQSATRTTEKLIEASTGMKFAVRYTIKPSFRLHGADGVSIHLYADGQHLYGKTVGATMFRREFSQTHSIVKYFCHERNTWMDAKLAFGSLQIGRVPPQTPLLESRKVLTTLVCSSGRWLRAN